MVEKKTAAIIVLCITMILCIGLWSNSMQEANRLEGELWELEGDYEKLARVRTSLEENYSELKTEKEDLEKDYTNLEIEKDTLETEYSLIKIEYESLKADILGLSNTLSLYSDNYRILKEDYDELNSLFEAGEAIAESAEWVSEDERLNVTSKLITSGTYWITYNVRVTVTNVGDEPIDKVVILLFPYINGKFTETYYGYKSHSVESLYLGETYSYDFTGITEDMTSYKVLAVVG